MNDSRYVEMLVVGSAVLPIPTDQRHGPPTEEELIREQLRIAAESGPRRRPGLLDRFRPRRAAAPVDGCQAPAR